MTIFYILALIWLLSGLMAMYLWGRKWRSIGLDIIIVCFVIGPIALMIILLLLASEIKWRW